MRETFLAELSCFLSSVTIEHREAGVLRFIQETVFDQELYT